MEGVFCFKMIWTALGLICLRTALKKKWRPQVRERWDAFAFSFAFILILSRKKTKETGDEMEGEAKWRMF